MSVNYAALRSALHARVRSSHEQRRASQLNAPDCDHHFQAFRESIVSDRTDWSGTAYFIVKACLRCRVKHLVKLVVER